MKKYNIRGILCLLLLSVGMVACGINGSYNDFPYLEYDITQIRQAYDSGDLSIEALTRAYLERMERIDRNGPALNAMIRINPDALQIAKELDNEMREGRLRGPLHGIPVVLKDNIDTHDKMPCTAGSRALRNSYPLQDSYVAEQLRKAGAVILGKSNLSEWANFRGQLSTSGWSGLGGLTKNPYVLDRNPCGSSSGSAVAVSANLSILAIGTETNGSIVCPSHNNGIVGIKPTVGLISRSGIIPISHTMDSAGPMARTVRDAAICLGALTGMDPEDASMSVPDRKAYRDYTAFLKEDGLEGKRLGWFTASRGSHFKVDALMEEAVRDMREQGAEIIEIERIFQENIGASSFEVMLYEYKDGLNRYFASLGEKAAITDLTGLIAFNISDSVELLFFDQIYLEMAAEKGGLDSETYKTALKNMLASAGEKGIDRIMKTYDLDAIIAPTGGPAWKTDLINGDHFQLSSSSPAARAGYPNITVPMGFVGNLPVGISFFGRAWNEPLLLEIAYAYEQATRHRKAPAFIVSD
ncbi:MAG: amidase [FCB group bacterium]|nr:amidase [FCB group bacterium]